jgi:hypothetical protein
MGRIRLLAAVAFAASLFTPCRAGADVGPPVGIRWSGEWPAPARAGAIYVGHFELVAADPVTVENLEVRGDGWTILGVDAGSHLTLPRDGRRVVTFRAVPTDPAAPIVVSGTANGIPFRRAFRLDRDHTRPGPAQGSVRSERAPVLSGTKPRATTQSGRNIRFHGTFRYQRMDGQWIGADNIVVRVMDDDSPFSDEEIGRFITDSEGNFDQTIFWDDCDFSGCDEPDVYLIYEAANHVVDVRNEDGEQYTWSTEDNVISDFTGTDIDFGFQTPNGSDAAVFLFNAINRARRFAHGNGLWDGALTFCVWPSSQAGDGAFYSKALNEIHISPNRTWNEATASHEYGHRLAAQCGVVDTPNYNNGFCDTPKPGHCIWCPENLKDAWQEGYADWYAAAVLSDWRGTYDDIPLGLGDTNYQYEYTKTCDTTAYANAMTEGYVAALLLDIADSDDEDEDGGAPDCSMDELHVGAPTILTFAYGNTATLFDWIAKFRNFYPLYDENLWTTIENVAPSINFPEPVPTF